MGRAAEKAVELLDKYCIDNPAQLELEVIANAEYLIVEEAPLKNELGRIVYNEDYGLIKISSRIKEPGMKRFTLAHEIGHYCISKGRKLNKHGCSLENLTTFKNNLKSEQEANIFAAELLMHKPWFSDFIRDKEINMELIKNIASYFNVSVTAAAIRYAEIGQYPIAVIMSKDGKVTWCYMNEYFPLKFIPKGYFLRKDSIAYDYFEGKEVQETPDLVPGIAWFREDYKCTKEMIFWENDIVMPNYNSVLTILWEFDG